VGFGVAFGLGGGSPLFLLLGGLGCPAVAIGLGRLERGRARERRERLRREAPGALEAIAACLEAGLPLRQATAVVAGLSPPGVGALLHRVGQGVAVGLTDAEAWLGLAGDEVLGPLAKDVARAAGWGTTVGAILTDYAADLRRDLAGEARTRARAVGVRTALPLAACYLPAFVLLGLVPILLAGVFALVGG
jgi:pilus assembly protein TadC